MATLTAFVWIFALIMFFQGAALFFQQTLESTELFLPRTSVGIWLLVHVCSVVLFTLAIYWDLYGVIPPIDSANLLSHENVRVTLIAGFVALGTTSILSFLMRRRAQKNLSSSTSHQKGSTSLSIRLAFELLSLVSSVLGIISFYLDYLK